MRQHDAIISSWAVEQVVPWLSGGPWGEKAMVELPALCRTDPDVFLFEIAQGRATVSHEKLPDPRPWAEAIRVRVERYRVWLEETARQRCPDLAVRLAVCVGDISVSDPVVPVFSFQKPSGNRSILLPDVDLLGLDFSYPSDMTLFERKLNKAIFAGSTSGGWITTEKLLADGAIPRIMAAKYFAGSDYVTFKLPVICQYDTEETAQLLRNMGFGNNIPVEWAETLQHKFVFSMDGNGAACSRVVLAMSSNSVLLKYRSEHLLYYFSGMQSWCHFVPIEEFSDVIEVVKVEQKNPGLFAHVSSAANEFCRSYLTRDAAMAYTERVLRLYASALTGAPAGAEYYGS